jgi:hypothetical protein
MQISPDSSAMNAPSSRGPSVQWIGVQWQGGYYALPLSSLAAVFKTSNPQGAALQSDLDIEVHDGAPVFMRAFSHCFDLSAHVQPSAVQEELKWALILNIPGAAPVGCRVHQVLGPFWDELKADAVHHDGQDWLLVHARGGVHA